MSQSAESAIVGKVIDLGLAQQLAPNTYGGLETWQWMAPETIMPTLKTAYTEKCDVYSFGIVYDLFSRSLPPPLLSLSPLPPSQIRTAVSTLVFLLLTI